MVKKHLKPQFYDDESDLDSYLRTEQDPASDSDDGLDTLSFGSLKTAQMKLDEEDQKDRKDQKDQKDQKGKKLGKKQIEKPGQKTDLKDSRKIKQKELIKQSTNDSESDSGGFFDNESDSEEDTNDKGDYQMKKGKHAPKEFSSKKKVSRIREIPGLVAPRQQSSLYQDIRFDTAFGKANQDRIRKDYKFLDEYRQNEVDEINKIMKDKKLKNKLSQREIQDLEYKAKSLRSRLESLKNKDTEKEVIKNYMEQHKGQNKYYLKNSERKKILQKHKFDNMKASQREKVIERKRKRRLGKEFKELEFNKPRN